jgi:hypothetical protein
MKSGKLDIAGVLRPHRLITRFVFTDFPAGETPHDDVLASGDNQLVE